MDDIAIEELAYALRGVSYPAQRWQLLAWADYNATGGRLRDAVWQLPERTYAHLYDVHDAIRAERVPPDVPGPVIVTQPHRSRSLPGTRATARMHLRQSRPAGA